MVHHIQRSFDPSNQNRADSTYASFVAGCESDLITGHCQVLLLGAVWVRGFLHTQIVKMARGGFYRVGRCSKRGTCP
jgi:hypothetical protein